MRPSIIVSTGALGALFAAALVARPELSIMPRSEIVPALLPHLAVLVLVLFAVYALAAIVATTAGLIFDALALRRRIGRTPGRGSAVIDFYDAVDTSALRSLAPRPAPEFQPSARSGEAILIERRFDRREARAEAARIFYISLARSHFFSALIGLATLAMLGLAQHSGPVPFLPEAIPTIPAALLLAGLVFLALLARLALDVTIEPLVEAMSRIPNGPAEMGLLREPADRFGSARFNVATGRAGAATEPGPLTDRLVGVLEESHHALIEAVGHLSTATDALAAQMQSSVEEFQAMLRQIALPAQPVIESSNIEELRFAELRSAVEALTVALREVQASAAMTQQTNTAADLPPAPEAAGAGLALELKKLLEEM